MVVENLGSVQKRPTVEKQWISGHGAVDSLGRYQMEANDLTVEIERWEHLDRLAGVSCSSRARGAVVDRPIPSSETRARCSMVIAMQRGDEIGGHLIT